MMKHNQCDITPDRISTISWLLIITLQIGIFKCLAQFFGVEKDALTRTKPCEKSFSRSVPGKVGTNFISPIKSQPMRSIFLDLNHWIALARAVYGKTVRPDHNTACERLREAVASKKIFLPLQISHLVEYSRDNSISRRQRMAAVFEEFTQNYFFAAWSTVLPYEFSRGISITFGLPNISADPVIFEKGPLFSLPEKAKELIRQDPDIHLGLDFHESLSGLPGMLYDLLTFPNETGRLKQLTSDRQRQSDYASGREAGRRNFNSIDEAIRAQAAIYTFHHQRELQVCLHLYGKILRTL
jgi:hypothetical protein